MSVEDEFYDMENFTGLRDFHQRAATFQAYYNLLRPNMNKDDLSPWQIIKKQAPHLDIAVAKLPPLMLDWLAPDYATKEQLQLRGYHVPCYPSFQRFGGSGGGRNLSGICGSEG
jgi:hypothetical protein